MNQSIILTIASFMIAYMCFSSDLQAVDNESRIVGEWVPASISKTGMGVIKEFKKNGQFVLHTGVIMSMKYKENADKLTYITAGKEVTQNLKITKNKLIMTESSSGVEQILERVKDSKGKGLVGKWTGKHKSGGQQQIEFTKSGNMYFEILFKSYKGTYEVKGNIVIEKLVGLPEKSWSCSYEKEVLNMKVLEGKKVYKLQKKK